MFSPILNPCKTGLTRKQLLNCRIRSVSQLNESFLHRNVRALVLRAVSSYFKNLFLYKLHAIRLRSRLKFKAFNKNKIHLVWSR